MSTENIDIRISEDGSRVVRRNLDDLGTSARGAGEGVRGLGVASQFTSGLFKSLATGIAGIGLFGIARDILDTSRSMETLRAQLLGLTGDARTADASFATIVKFAKDTPFEIAGLTQSFITLKNFGIEPTTKVLQAITDQAAKAGGSQQQLEGITLALGQAWAKGKLQGQEILQLINQQVPVWKILEEVTGKNTAALQDMSEKGLLGRDVIQKLIEKMGELAQGSNARAMDTLNGKISNLSDAWHNFENTLLNDRSRGFIAGIVDGISNTLNLLARNISTTIDAQLEHARARVSTFNSLGVVGRAVADFSGYDINVEKNKIDSLTRQKSKQEELLRITQETNRVAEEARQKTLASPAEKTAKARTSASTTHAAVDTTGADYIKQLEREVALLGDSSKLAQTKYDLQYGSLAKITPRQKEIVESLTAEIDKNTKQNEQWKQLVEDANAYYDLRKEIADLAKSDLSADTFGGGLGKIQDSLKSGVITQKQAKELQETAIACLDGFGEQALALKDLALLVVNRSK